MHQLRIVDGGAPREVMAALREALSGGPALTVHDARATRLAAQAEPSGGEHARVPVDVALVIQTSGSSGAPKAVALTNAALRASSDATHRRLGGEGQWLLALPLTYIAGLSVLVRSAVAGFEPVLMPSGPFDAEHFLRAAAELSHERRYTSLVPVQLQRVLDYVAEGSDDDQATLQRFDAILIGGQKLEPALRQQAESAGVNVIETFGSSETCGGCVYDGVPLDGVHVEVDEATGELLIAGPVLADGYLDAPELTAEKFIERHGQRWYRTGDAGTVVGGTITVSGRLDRVVISGGLKISLAAVEEAAEDTDGVSDVFAIHIPDVEWGSRVALVAVGTTTEETEDRLYESVVSKLGRVAAPKVIVFVEQTPRLSSGKPDYVAMTALATEAASRASSAG
jgi:O-succinylbenzoic acid--CoA ligase